MANKEIPRHKLIFTYSNVRVGDSTTPVCGGGNVRHLTNSRHLGYHDARD